MPDGIYKHEWIPSGRRKGCILALHGMESHSDWFAMTARCLGGLGWAVWAFDRPGWGRTPGRSGHLESYADFVRQVSIFVEEARHYYSTVHLLGMSWGGMGALYFALRRSWLIDSVTLLAPGLALKKSFPLSQSLKAAASFIKKDKTAEIMQDFSPELFSDNRMAREFVRDDPLRNRTVTASFVVETLKMRRFIAENAGKRLLPPALCLLGSGDRMIDYAPVRNLCEKAGCVVDRIRDAGHALVLDCPEEVAERLDRHASAERMPAKNRKRIWVVGGGAVGGTVAGLCAFAGHETGLLVRERQLAVVRDRGLYISCADAFRSTSGTPLAAAVAPAELPGDPDLVVMAVKNFDTEAALRQLKGAIPPQAVIASLQNGLANEERIAAVFPDNPIAAASVCASLEMTDNGATKWPDDRGGLAAALYRGDADLVKQLLAAIFPHTGMEYVWVDGKDAALRLKWSKLMLNIGFNALNSLTGMASAKILANPQYGVLALAALREGFAVMDRMGLKPVDLPGYRVAALRLLLKTPDAVARRLMAWQAGRGSEAAFSMRQDVLNQRKQTEIDDLNGAIVRQAEALKLPVDANKKLCALVKSQCS